MSRPKKNTIDYYPHDVNPSRSMRLVEHAFGLQGYGWWFKLLDLLGNTPGHYYNAGTPKYMKYLAMATLSSEEFCLEVLSLLSELEAIDSELWTCRVIWCQNFVNRLEDVYKNREGGPPKRPHYSPIQRGNPGFQPGNPSFQAGNPSFQRFPPPETPKLNKTKLNKTKLNKTLVHPFDSNYRQCSEMLYNALRARNPNHKEPDFNEWDKHIKYLNEIDGKNIAVILIVIRWCQEDPFWQNNILSTIKLRKHFEQLYLKMNSPYKPRSRHDENMEVFRKVIQKEEEKDGQKHNVKALGNSSNSTSGQEDN